MTKKYAYHGATCSSCGAKIENQHPNTKEENKWIRYEIDRVQFYLCAKCKNREKGE